MNYVLVSGSVIVLGLLTFYYIKPPCNPPKKLILISWSKDQNSIVTSKISKLPKNIMYDSYKRMANFTYNHATYGKLSRWRDKKYIEYVEISPIAVPA